METSDIRTRVLRQMEQAEQRGIIRERRFFDDEQLVRSEQLQVLEQVFNANVRDRELGELSFHFAPILRQDHPVHLALWGKTGTGKTLTMMYFLNLLAEICRQRKIPLRHVHIDLCTSRPCFRALNDLACLLNASRRYQKGISLEELMQRIESALATYRGYLVLFIDEVDNVRRDKDTFLAFLIRRLPQRIPAKLVLVFASNRLNWTENLDPRVRSFLKLNELVFEPYDALDLQRILHIRVTKALKPGSVEPGVLEKIAALASRQHGDARQAVALLAQSAYLAEKAGEPISLPMVAEAAEQIEHDKYVTLVRTAPPQLQAALAATIEAVRSQAGDAVTTGQVYDTYRAFCERALLRPLAGRAFGELLTELDMYSLVLARVQSRGRYGRSRQIGFDLPDELISKLYETIYLNFGLASGTAPR